MLNSAKRIFSNFNGATTITLGDVTLLVIAGPVTQQLLFSVVEDLGPYNAIVGQTWLHLMKAIPSTYYQTVSYLTNARQVDLLSSRLLHGSVINCLCRCREGRAIMRIIISKIIPRIEITSCHPDQGEKEGPIGYGSLGNSSVGQAKEVHICQCSPIQ